MKTAIILMLLVLAGSTVLLTAQSLDEDQLMMRQYKLPEQAVAESLVVVRDSLLTLDGTPYTGTVFVRYSNGQLQTATQYVNGRKHGSALVWYPDGKPQLISNYREGRLNGRFKGWYQFGAVIYDLVLKDSAYAGDQMYETDTTRETGSGDEDEPGGDSRTQEND